MAKDTSSRKYQLTINNPVDKGYSHEVITEKLKMLKSLVYFCMADEQGQAFHTHIFIACSSVVRFSTIKNTFPEAHIETAKGSYSDNISYIEKSGKWEADEKHGTKIEGTFEEWGEKQNEMQGVNSKHADLLADLQNGLSTVEIIENNPAFIMQADRIERARLLLLKSPAWREVNCEYWYGDSGTGKTRSALNLANPSDIFRVTTYQHPFDSYSGEKIIILDEYRKDLEISLLLNLTDGHKMELPARYSNKPLMCEAVYIVSNFSFTEQFGSIKGATFNAICRRFNKIKCFTELGKPPLEWTVEEYLANYNNDKTDTINNDKRVSMQFLELPNNTLTPFDEPQQNVQEQLPL
jgi:hypothetical protein